MARPMLRVALAVPFVASVFAAPNFDARQLNPLPTPGKPKLMMANNAVNWLANVTIGDQTFQMLVDTGSAYTWIGANKTFVPGAGATNTHLLFEIQYGSGYANGTHWVYDIEFAGIKVKNQGIGVASFQEGYGVDGTDGILGLGGVVQNANVVKGKPYDPTVLDNMKAQGLIEDQILGLHGRQLQRGETYAESGELSVGWVDEMWYEGGITWSGPTPNAGPDGTLAGAWVVPVEGLVSNGSPLESYKPMPYVLFDTGVTHLFCPPEPFFEWLGIAGGEYDRTHFLSSFATRPTATFGFKINGTVFELAPEQYLVPEHLYSVWNLPSDKIWGHISTAGPGNFYVGKAFLDHVYTIYDTDNRRIGFAKSSNFSGPQ